MPSLSIAHLTALIWSIACSLWWAINQSVWRTNHLAHSSLVLPEHHMILITIFQCATLKNIAIRAWMSNTICVLDISFKAARSVIQYVHGVKGKFSNMCLRFCFTFVLEIVWTVFNAGESMYIHVTVHNKTNHIAPAINWRYEYSHPRWSHFGMNRWIIPVHKSLLSANFRILECYTYRVMTWRNQPCSYK